MNNTPGMVMFEVCAKWGERRCKNKFVVGGNEEEIFDLKLIADELSPRNYNDATK